MKALELFDVIPGWVYALAVVVLLLVVGERTLAVAHAEREAAVSIALLEGERAAAAGALAKQTALVLLKTNELNTLRLQQEKRDGEAQATIAQLGEDLRRRARAGGGGGLRDPHAPSCGGEPPAGSGAAAGAGGEDPAQAGGVLSAPLEGLLLELVADADAINIAYESCRADALNLRATIRSLQLSPLVPGPASAGPP